MLELDNNYKNPIQIDLHQLRDHRPNVFWNLIWHFQSQGLPYDHLIPYKTDRAQAELLRTNSHL